jgi:hypothetical protein
LLRNHPFRGNERLFQEVYLALGEFDPQFGRNFVAYEGFSFIEICWMKGGLVLWRFAF